MCANFSFTSFCYLILMTVQVVEHSMVHEFNWMMVFITLEGAIKSEIMTYIVRT